jgi:transcriptional regulator with XRE-family HTH domain
MTQEEKAIADMISAFMKSRRIELGLTQTQVSELAGLGFRTVQRIESGEFIPDGKSLLKMSKALNCYFFLSPKESDEEFVIAMRNRWKLGSNEQTN